MNYREVAASLGLSPAGVGVAMSEGRIRSTYVNGRRHVEPEEVERYRREQLGKKLGGQDPASRFWPKVNKTDDCWLWTGGKTTAGYGTFMVEHGRLGMAHRWAYEALVGPIPAGLHLDHLCRTPACVRPDHLEPVTVGENIRRGLAMENGKHNLVKTHCPQGHPYAGDNLIEWRGRRICRQCRKDASHRHYQRSMGRG